MKGFVKILRGFRTSVLQKPVLQTTERFTPPLLFKARNGLKPAQMTSLAPNSLPNKFQTRFASMSLASMPLRSMSLASTRLASTHLASMPTTPKFQSPLTSMPSRKYSHQTPEPEKGKNPKETKESEIDKTLDLQALEKLLSDNIKEKGVEHTDVADLHFRIAEILEKSKDYDLAKHNFERALLIVEKNAGYERNVGKYSIAVAQILTRLSYYYGYDGDPRKQKLSCEAAYSTLVSQRTPPLDIGYALSSRAYAYFKLGDMPKARSLWEEALKTFETHPEKQSSQEAFISYCLSKVYQLYSEHFLQRAKEIMQSKDVTETLPLIRQVLEEIPVSGSKQEETANPNSDPENSTNSVNATSSADSANAKSKSKPG